MKGDETMDRKRCTLALMAVLALGLCKLQMVVAQVPPQGNQNYGTFGNRTLGQPLVPAPSTFGGGIQTAPGGSFLGRSDGSPASATPGLQNSTRRAHAQRRRAARPERRCFASIARGGARCSRTPVHHEFGPPVGPRNEWAGRHGPDGAGPWPAGTGTPVAAAPPAASPRQPYSRSPELSDRLTQIARTKGLLFGPAIDVYLSNNVALMQGAVGTPGDCVLMAKVLALEPEVLQIDNRVGRHRSDPGHGPGSRAEAKVLRAAGSRGPTALGPITRQAQTRARPRTRQQNSPVAPSRLSIRPRTPRPSRTRLAATPLRSRRAIAKTFMKIAPGRSALARALTGMRSNTGFIRACTRLRIRTTVGNYTTASCHEQNGTDHD